jgi:hypothetical protein
MSASVTRPEETALFLADRCAELEAENAKLREAARWRKWPEEWPDTDGRYLVFMDSNDPIDDGKWLGCCNYQNCQWFGQAWGVGQLYFKTIGPLPGGE